MLMPAYKIRKSYPRKDVQKFACLKQIDISFVKEEKVTPHLRLLEELLKIRKGVGLWRRIVWN